MALPSKPGSAARPLAVAAGLAVLGGALWWRRHPSACPYGQRFFVQAPHPERRAEG